MELSALTEVRELGGMDIHTYGALVHEWYQENWKPSGKEINSILLLRDHYT